MKYTWEVIKTAEGRQYKKKYYSQNQKRKKNYYKNKRNLYFKNYNLLKRYGITLDDYNLMLSKQDCKCLLCGKSHDKEKFGLVVDHCHNTKKVRGLLCHDCNTGLGKFKEDPELLKKAINYLLL